VVIHAIPDADLSFVGSCPGKHRQRQDFPFMLQIATTEKRLFPLHLPPIDWLFHNDDRPDYPMVSYIELDFSGPIDRGLLADALITALGRHPLLIAKIERAKANRLCWVPISEGYPEVVWLDENETLIEEPLDIRSGPGLRIWGRPTAEGTRLTLQVHHAATDGTGAYRFIGDWLVAYGQRLPGVGDQCEFGEIDARTLRTRRNKMLGSDGPADNWELWRESLKELWRMNTERISPLKCPAECLLPNRQPKIQTQWFDAAAHKRLRDLATARGVMLNDLLLWQLFRAIGIWNAEGSGPKAPGNTVRVLVPADMRDGDDFAMPAANMTAYTFVTCRASEWKSDGLLDKIRGETAKIKSGTPQHDYAKAITGAMNTPRLTRWLLKGNRCFATAVLSNAGDPARRFTGRLPRSGGKVRLGELTLEKITGVPPLRSLTRASVSVSSYGRGMAVSMRCDPRHFGDAGTQDFLKLYCDQLSTLLTPELVG